jgi:hypothetical protein
MLSLRCCWLGQKVRKFVFFGETCVRFDLLAGSMKGFVLFCRVRFDLKSWAMAPMGALTYLPTQSSFDPYLPNFFTPSSLLHDSHTQALNTMTGNKSNEERPPPPPPSPAPNPTSPPMTNRHHEEIMTAIRSLSNAPKQPAHHPLASISGVEIFLRDLANTPPGKAHRFNVNIRPSMGDLGSDDAIVEYFTNMFEDLSPERGDVSFGIMRRAYEASRPSGNVNWDAQGGAGATGAVDEPGEGGLTGISGGEKSNSQSRRGTRNTDGETEQELREIELRNQEDPQRLEQRPHASQTPRLNDSGIEKEEVSKRDEHRDPSPPAVKKPAQTTTKSATPKPAISQSHSGGNAGIDAQPDKDEPANDVSAKLHQIARTYAASNTEKKHAAPASKVATKRTEPATGTAGSMPPPPLPQPPPVLSDYQNRGPGKPRSASAQPTTTWPNAQAPRQTRAASMIPVTDRATRLSRGNVSNAVPVGGAGSNVTRTPYRDSKGKILRNYDLLEGDDLDDKTINEKDPLEIERENARLKREAKKAKAAAAVKRTASDAADDDEESLWQRPPKKAKRQDPPNDTFIDRAEQADRKALSEHLTAVSQPNDFDSEDPDAPDAPGEDGDNLVDLDDAVDSDDDTSEGDDGKPHQVEDEDDLKDFIVLRLQNFPGQSAIHGELLRDLRMSLVKVYGARDGRGAMTVHAKAFAGAVGELVEAGRVQFSGGGAAKRLWLVASRDDSKRDDGRINRTDDDASDDGEEEDDEDAMSLEDGLEARNPDDAHIFRKHGKVVKPGNSHQPNRLYVDRHAKPETSWIGDNEDEASDSGPVLGKNLRDEKQHADRLLVKQSKRKGQQSTSVEQNSSQHRQSDASPRKPAQKRKAETDNPVLEEEGMLLPVISLNARDANSDPDNGEPPRKKEKKPAKDKTRSKE